MAWQCRGFKSPTPTTNFPLDHRLAQKPPNRTWGCVVAALGGRHDVRPRVATLVRQHQTTLGRHNVRVRSRSRFEYAK